MAAKKPAPSAAPDRLRVRVWIDPRCCAGVVMPLRRIRAGHVLTREPQVIEASPEVVAALEADPVLAVERIEE
jgi:hypothetical protein